MLPESEALRKPGWVHSPRRLCKQEMPAGANLHPFCRGRSEARGGLDAGRGLSSGHSRPLVSPLAFSPRAHTRVSEFWPSSACLPRSRPCQIQVRGLQGEDGSLMLGDPAGPETVPAGGGD